MRTKRITESERQVRRGLTLFFLWLTVCCPAIADNRYRLIGISKTHLALQELRSCDECYDADDPIDCKYSGLDEKIKETEGVMDPKTKKPVRFKPMSLRIHFLKYRLNEWTEDLSSPSFPKGMVNSFQIYDAVPDVKKCTSPAAAERRLTKVYEFAKKIGIRLELETQISSKPLTQELNISDCYSKNRSCRNRYFSLDADPDNPEASPKLTWRFLEIKSPTLEYDCSLEQVFILPLLRHRATVERKDYEIYQLSIMVRRLATNSETPRFLVSDPIPAHE